MLRALGSRGADDARDAPEDGARRGIARFIRHPIETASGFLAVHFDEAAKG